MNCRIIKKTGLIAVPWVILCLALWLVLPGRPEAKSWSIKGYGGKLRPVVVKELGKLNQDLKDIQFIIKAGPEKIVCMGRYNQISEYLFVDGALWHDSSPVISGVSSFHFEYRDRYGNLLTMVERNLSSIETIGYTLRIGSGEGEILTYSRVEVSPVQHKTKEKVREKFALTSISMNY